MSRRTAFLSVLGGVLVLLGVGTWIDSKSARTSTLSARSVSALQNPAQEQGSSGFNREVAQASLALEIEPVHERASIPAVSPKNQRVRSRAPASVH